MRKKLNYDGNFPVSHREQTIINPPGGNKKDSYVKCEQFYFFDKDKINYSLIGFLNDGVLDIIVEYISELIENNVPFRNILDNIK